MVVLDSILLSVVYVGIVLCIVEAGLLIFISKVYRKPDKNLLFMFLLTVCWGGFLLLENISDQFGAELHLFSKLLGTLPLLVFLFLFPSLTRFFNRNLLILGEIIAMVVIGLEWLSSWYDVHLFSSLLSILPPLMSYWMVMEATITKKKR